MRLDQEYQLDQIKRISPLMVVCTVVMSMQPCCPRWRQTRTTPTIETCPEHGYSWNTYRPGPAAMLVVAV
jgi:hypothetical protein